MRRLALIALILSMLGCGRTGSPIPPSHALVAPPESLSLSGRDGKITLTWSKPNKTVKGKVIEELSGFVVEREIFLAPKESCPTCPNDGTATLVVPREPQRYTEEGATPGCRYRLRVRALDRHDRPGAPSDFAEITYLEVPPPQVTLEPLENSARIIFSPPKLDADLAQRGLAVYDVQGALVLQLPPTAEEGVIGGLVNDADYTFQCRWSASSKEGWILESKPVEVRVRPRDLVPPKPPDELVAFADPGEVSLNWLSARGEVYEEVLIERATEGADFDELVKLPGSALNYLDKAVSPGVAYLYRLRAVDAAKNVGAYTAVVKVRALGAKK